MVIGSGLRSEPDIVPDFVRTPKSRSRTAVPPWSRTTIGGPRPWRTPTRAARLLPHEGTEPVLPCGEAAAIGEGGAPIAAACSRRCRRLVCRRRWLFSRSSSLNERPVGVASSAASRPRGASGGESAALSAAAASSSMLAPATLSSDAACLSAALHRLPRSNSAVSAHRSRSEGRSRAVDAARRGTCRASSSGICS